MALPYRSSSMRSRQVYESERSDVKVTLKPRSSDTSQRSSSCSASTARPRSSGVMSNVKVAAPASSDKIPMYETVNGTYFNRSSGTERTRGAPSNTSRTTESVQATSFSADYKEEKKDSSQVQIGEHDLERARDSTGEERKGSSFVRSPTAPGPSSATRRRRSATSLEGNLVCRVCNERFKNPRILPCLHTFCAGCIARLQTYPFNVEDCGDSQASSTGKKEEEYGGQRFAQISSERQSPTSPPGDARTPSECNRDSPEGADKQREQTNVSCSSRPAQRLVLCPVCLKETRLSITLVELPRNYVVERKVAEEEKAFVVEAEVTRLECDSCAEWNESCLVSARCLDCEENLCAWCELSHRRQKKTKGHQLVDLTATSVEQETVQNRVPPPSPIAGTPRPSHSRVRAVAASQGTTSWDEPPTFRHMPRSCQVPCPRHPDQDLGVFCRTCGVPGCRSCVILDHREHECRPLSPELFRQQMEEVQRLIRDVAPRVAAVDQQLQKVAEAQLHIREKARQVTAEVNVCMDSYLTAVKEHRQQLVKQVESLAAEKQRALGVTERHLKQVRADVDQTCTFVSDMIENATDAEILSVKKLITDRLRSLRQMTEICAPHLLDTWGLHFCPSEKGKVIHSFQMFGLILCRMASAANSTVTGDGFTTARVGHESTLCLHINSEDGSQYTERDVQVKAWLLSQNRSVRRTTVHLLIQKDGTYALKFTPTYAGIHFLHVAVNNQPVQDSPFKFSVKGQWREHKGMWHCCTVCSTGGRGGMTCGCRGATDASRGCFHGQQSHPGGYHWSCCGKMTQQSECSNAPPQNFVRQVTL